MSSSFQFKQFTVQQDICAMKVGTDGVLLGAWVTAKEGTILDLGSGTGLIALMLAQRSKTATIDAIDMEESAYLQTIQNINESLWKNRMNVFHTSVQKFIPDKKYDLMVCNPPYFINSTKAPEQQRTTARHNDTLSHVELINAVKRLLDKEGLFALILPTLEAELFIEEALQNEIYLTRKCTIKPNPNKASKRVLMEFSFLKNSVKHEGLTIETEKRHQYTKEYINLTRDFYLNF